MFLLFAGTCALAQGIVKGRLKDAATLEPIPFGMVYFKKHPALSILSDVDGNFKIPARILPDSAYVSAGSFTEQKVFIQADTSRFLQVLLTPESYNLGEVVVTSGGEDPAYAIIRKVISRKEFNHKNSLEAYNFENYKKLKFGIKNANDQLNKRKIFKPFSYIFNNIDSTEETPYLPVFFMETVSGVNYRKDAGMEKEVVEAVKTSGISNASISSFFDDFSGNFYIYDNFLAVFGKNFFSPIADHCFAHYGYELLDSAALNNHWCYKIKYWPKHKQELSFAGTMWISDTSFAVEEINGVLSETANLNFITSLTFFQKYQQVGKAWLVGEEKMVVNGEFFIPHEMRSQKFVAKKISLNSKFTANMPKEKEFYTGEKKVYAKDALQKTNAAWATLRPEPLTASEAKTYLLIDSLKGMPVFKNLLILFTGYRSFGKFEIGPYYRIYSYNPVEGNRFRMGFRTTPKLSKRLLVEGYGAYGIRDQKIKFGTSTQYLISKSPRKVVGAGFKHDVEQLGFSQNTFRLQDNFLYTIFKIYPYNKLNRVNDGQIFYEHEWMHGIYNRIILRRSFMTPAGKLKYEKNAADEVIGVPNIQTTEISLLTHFCKQEKYLEGDYHRITLTGKNPAFDLMYTMSVKALRSDYAYKKLVLSMQHRLNFKHLGFLKYRLEAGKIWGITPFPLLEMHSGNQTLFYDPNSFNTMNFFEFVSDQYASAFLSYHLDGFILNKIPLIRKLKWREVLTCSVVKGTLRNENRHALELPERMYVPSKGYAEAGFGIDNIFRFFRLDAIWRLSYLENPGARPLVIKGSMQFTF